jgi:hypothetical protein
VSISNLSLRPFRAEDAALLDQFRKVFLENGRVDVPYGYSALGVETVISEKSGRVVAGTIGTKGLIVDFCKDQFARGEDIYGSVLLAERTLSYNAQQAGCAVSYVAIPAHMAEWLSIVKRSGYKETFHNCIVLKRALMAEKPQRNV